MIGGYQILDLRGLNLEITQQAQSLTDQNVLKQLTLLLRDSIDKDYNFNKPLENQLKPVLIRFRDKKNGEKIEGATFGELSVKGNYYSFLISGHLSGLLTLLLNVEFEEITNDYGNQEWVIKTATIQLIDASSVLEGNIDVEGNLTATTLEQSQANWSTEITLNMDGNMIAGGLELTNIYNRFEVINGMLWVIANIKITNSSENNYDNTCRIDGYVELPFKYADKIYDLLGKKASQIADDSYVIIAGHHAESFDGVSYSDVEDSDYHLFLTNRDNINIVSPFIEKHTSLKLNAGDSVYISGRLPLTLL